MIDRKNFFDQPMKNDEVTYENTRKILLVKMVITRLIAC